MNDIILTEEKAQIDQPPTSTCSICERSKSKDHFSKTQWCKKVNRKCIECIENNKNPKYEGEYKNGVEHGKGIQTWFDGQR